MTVCPDRVSTVVVGRRVCILYTVVFLSGAPRQGPSSLGTIAFVLFPLVYVSPVYLCLVVCVCVCGRFNSCCSFFFSSFSQRLCTSWTRSMLPWISRTCLSLRTTSKSALKTPSSSSSGEETERETNHCRTQGYGKRVAAVDGLGAAVRFGVLWASLAVTP